MGERRQVTGIAVAVLTAFAFAGSGPFVKPLLLAGWSPSAAVLVRLVASALVVLPLALAHTRGNKRVWLRRWRWIVAYGLVAIGGSQLLYYSAIALMPVSVALLIQYLAPVLLLMLAWARTRIRPATMALIGAALSVGGLILALDITGSATTINWAGVAFAASAAITACCYYLMAASVPDDLPPTAMISGSMFVGAALMLAVGVTGLAPLTFTFGSVEMLGGEFSWWVPMLVVVLVGTVAGYLGGLFSAKALGSRMASFFGLLEVLATMLVSAILLGELPVGMQLVGSALVIAGVVCVRLAPDTVTVDAPLGPITAPITLPVLEEQAGIEGDLGEYAEAQVGTIGELTAHTGPIALVATTMALPEPEPVEVDWPVDGLGEDASHADARTNAQREDALEAAPLETVQRDSDPVVAPSA